MNKWNPFEHHRGPYILGVLRDAPRRKAKVTYDLLPGKVEVDDIRDEAQALLSDKRDTILSVYVFSVREEQYVTAYRRSDFGLA